MAEQETINLGIVGIKNMGAYDSETTYEKLNVVTYDGSTYCALKNTKGNLPTNTEYWQLYAEKGEEGPQGPIGPAPVKGVDYWTAQDKAEMSTEMSEMVGEEVSDQVGSLVSATPLAASSVSGMTDTTRIYVNTTDGHWYYYNGSQWTDGGVYQATEDPEVIDIRNGADGDTYNTAGNSVRTQFSNVNTGLELLDNGIKYLKGKFKRGRLAQGVESNLTYRVISVDPISYDKDIVIKIADSFKIYVSYYDATSTYVRELGWITKMITIPKNTKFRVQIARSTEDTTETADVTEFKSKLTYESFIDNRLSKIENSYTNPSQIYGDGEYERTDLIYDYGNFYNSNLNLKGSNDDTSRRLVFDITTLTDGYLVLPFRSDVSFGSYYFLNTLPPTDNQNISQIISYNTSDGALSSYHVTKIDSKNAKINIKDLKQEHSNIVGIALTCKYDYLTDAYYYKVTKTTKKLKWLEIDENNLDDNLKQKIESQYYIPDYFTEQVAQKESTIVNKLMDAGKNKFSFVFITDTHWGSNQKHSPSIIKHILDNTPINDVVFGGDIITNVSTNKQDMIDLYLDWQNSFKFCRNNFYCVYGNHDRNDNNQTDPDAAFTNDEVYALLQSHNENPKIKYSNRYFTYYYDNEIEKTRYIVLSTGGFNTDTDEMQFLVNALNGMDTNWKAVIISHQFYNNNEIPWFVQQIEVMLDKYNSRQTGNITIQTYSLNLNYDFTNAKGRVVACIGGHMHKDMNYRTNGGIPVLLFDCDACVTISPAGDEVGTVNEQCITTIIGDYSNNKISCVRIGRGSDMEFDIVED